MDNKLLLPMSTILSRLRLISVFRAFEISVCRHTANTNAILLLWNVNFATLRRMISYI